MNAKILIIASLLLIYSILGVFGQKNLTNNLKTEQKSKIIKTIRPNAFLRYFSYDEMIARADAIFVGETETDLLHSKGTIVYDADKIHFSDYYTIRKIKVKKIIKNNSKIKLKKEINILERAVIFKQEGNLVRLIQEDYEEILPDNKYLFFIYKTKDNENILFNGKFSKYNLEKVEKDEDIKKKEWKARVLKDYSKELKEK